jgi:hypothetical protein
MLSVIWSRNEQVRGAERGERGELDDGPHRPLEDHGSTMMFSGDGRAEPELMRT